MRSASLKHWTLPVLALACGVAFVGCYGERKDSSTTENPQTLKSVAGKAIDGIKGAGRKVGRGLDKTREAVTSPFKGGKTAESTQESTDAKPVPIDDANLPAYKKINALLGEDSDLIARWAIDLGSVTVQKFWLPPAEADVDYILILTSKNELIAFDRKTGQAKWKTSVVGSITGNPCFTKYSIYFVTESSLVNLEINSGEPIWKLRMEFAPSGGPAVAEEVKGKPIIHIAGLDRKIYALDTRKSIWPPEQGIGKLTRKDIEIENFALNIIWRYPLYALPAGDIVYNDRQVFCTDTKYNVYAVSSTDVTIGKPKKEFIFRTQGPMVCPPVVVGPYLIVASRDRMVYCLHKRDLSVNWRYATGLMLDNTPYALIDKHIHTTTIISNTGDRYGSLIGLNDTDGKVKWNLENGRGVVALMEEVENVPEKRSIMVVANKDLTLSAHYASSGEEIWKTPGKGFSRYCQNAREPFVFASAYSGRIVCALTKRKK